MLGRLSVSGHPTNLDNTRGVQYECNWVNFQKRLINNAKLFISNPCDRQSFSLLIQFLKAFSQSIEVYCSAPKSSRFNWLVVLGLTAL